MAFEIITAENGVKYLKSSLIPYRHGFATRVGGVSKEAHTSSLNLAFDRGDDRETVLRNLEIFSEAVGVEAESVISLGQIHSTRVLTVDEGSRGFGYYINTDEKCDGYVTNTTGITLGVKSADCVPILMCDADAGVIGAVHAGWRGTVSGIAAECVRKMADIGAKAANIHVAIGPAIHACCYEVGEDFRDSVIAIAGESFADRFIKRTGEKLHADIISMNREILINSGISDGNIDISEYCTCCHPELFFSHRYSHGLRGTMLSVIAM